MAAARFGRCSVAATAAIWRSPLAARHARRARWWARAVRSSATPYRCWWSTCRPVPPKTGSSARVNRGFFCIDEIDLLEDHLVDLLIDVAASSENVVKREGLSVRHPAHLALVGSRNCAQGERRLQLLDRFDLSVDVRAPRDLASVVPHADLHAASHAAPSCRVVPAAARCARAGLGAVRVLPARRRCG